MKDNITLTRDCQATRIPSGEKITIPAGTEAGITQSLGGSYTIVCPLGMVRIEEADADALGMEITKAEESAVPEVLDAASAEKLCWERLKTVYDPEIPVNIVDLGLVYDLALTDKEDGTRKVEVKMTLTAPGCGMGPTIQADARSKVITVPGVSEAEVFLVWDPAWNQNMITEVGRMKLGMV
ncbi:MAG: putative Fe-S cluster assembly protein SufT [Blastochloris sp.]|jgi:probable FeS assembly SUF system protein SufT|nr:putative Fe-S cluster assembly protein SufT [Blastochloris sp.]